MYHLPPEVRLFDWLAVPIQSRSMQHMASIDAKFFRPLTRYALLVHGYDSQFLDWAVHALDSMVTK